MPTRYRGTAAETRALNAFIKLMRATNALGSHLARALAGEADLTMSQFAVLEALLHLGPMSQGDICGKLLLSGSNITTVIDNLEKRALVRRVRRTDDRRVVDVSLTAKGRQLIGGLFPSHARRITSLFAALSPRQQDELAALCRTLGLSIQDPSDNERGRR
jgi:MarR family transcriptional regulator, 2-MHQ and catechol-resistance regulon repressor